jgi:hypothetical protein
MDLMYIVQLTTDAVTHFYFSLFLLWSVVMSLFSSEESAGFLVEDFENFLRVLIFVYWRDRNNVTTF